MVLARLTSCSYCPVGVVESVGEHVPVAMSLNIPKKKGRFWVRCMNSGKYPLTIDSREVIGRYSALGEIQELDYNTSELTQVHNAGEPPKTRSKDPTEGVPEHLHPLYEQGK